MLDSLVTVALSTHAVLLLAVLGGVFFAATQLHRSAVAFGLAFPVLGALHAGGGVLRLLALTGWLGMVLALAQRRERGRAWALLGFLWAAAPFAQVPILGCGHAAVDYVRGTARMGHGVGIDPHWRTPTRPLRVCGTGMPRVDVAHEALYELSLRALITTYGVMPGAYDGPWIGAQEAREVLASGIPVACSELHDPGWLVPPARRRRVGGQLRLLMAELLVGCDAREPALVHRLAPLAGGRLWAVGVATRYRTGATLLLDAQTGSLVTAYPWEEPQWPVLSTSDPDEVTCPWEPFPIPVPGVCRSLR